MLDPVALGQKSQTKEGFALWKCAVHTNTRCAMDPDTPESHSASSEKLLRASELEAWLDIDVKTIYTYVARDIITYVKIQSNVRFRREEILDWLETHSRRPWRPNGKGAKRQ